MTWPSLRWPCSSAFFTNNVQCEATQQCQIHQFDVCNVVLWVRPMLNWQQRVSTLFKDNVLLLTRTRRKLIIWENAQDANKYHDLGQASRCDLVMMYLTSAWHAWSPSSPLALKLQQLDRLGDRDPRRQQTLMIRFAIFWGRRWRVFRSARSTAQVDSYESFFHSLAFLDAVGTYIILLRIFHQLIRDDAQVVLHHSSTRLVVTPWPIGFCWVFSPPIHDTRSPRVACRLWSHAA